MHSQPHCHPSRLQDRLKGHLALRQDGSSITWSIGLCFADHRLPARLLRLLKFISSTLSGISTSSHNRAWGRHWTGPRATIINSFDNSQQRITNVPYQRAFIAAHHRPTQYSNHSHHSSRDNLIIKPIYLRAAFLPRFTASLSAPHLLDSFALILTAPSALCLFVYHPVKHRIHFIRSSIALKVLRIHPSNYSQSCPTSSIAYRIEPAPSHLYFLPYIPYVTIDITTYTFKFN